MKPPSLHGGALLPGQTVTVAEREVGVGACAFCVAALNRGLKSRSAQTADTPGEAGQGGGRYPRHYPPFLTPTTVVW